VKSHPYEKKSSGLTGAEGPELILL